MSEAESELACPLDGPEPPGDPTRHRRQPTASLLREAQAMARLNPPMWCTCPCGARV